MELKKYHIAIAVLQEIRWKGKGMVSSGNHIVFYSGNKFWEHRTVFTVCKDIMTAKLKLNPVSE